MKIRKLFVNFLLLIISSSTSLIGISLVLEIIQTPEKTTRQQLQIREIEETRELEVDYPAKVKSVNNGFIPVYFPNRTSQHFRDSKYYPVGTLPNTPTYYCNEGYGLVTYKSDRFGLRNNDNKWDEIQNKGATFFIGDSFTHGACVNNEFVFTELFSNSLDRNTLNLGTGGNGPYEYLVLLKNVVKPIISSIRGKEFLVVLVFYDNDNVHFDKNIDRHLSIAKPIAGVSPDGSTNVSKEYLSIIDETISRNYPTNSEDILEKLKLEYMKMKEKKMKTESYSSFVQKVITLYPLRLRLVQLLNSYKLDPTIRAIKELGATCNTLTSCTPYVVYIPSSNYWRPNVANDNYKSLLEKSSKDFSINFLDSSHIINPKDKKNYSPIGFHLSKEGHKKLADFVVSKVRQR